MPTRTNRGTLLDLLGSTFGFDYVAPDDPRLSEEARRQQAAAESSGTMTPELAAALRNPANDEIQILTPDFANFGDARYELDGKVYLPGEDNIQLEEWGIDGGRAGKSPPFQLDPRYRIDPSPALPPGEDRIDLEGPIGPPVRGPEGGRAGKDPPLQLDPRYRIDSDPALAPGEDRITLEPEVRAAVKGNSAAAPVYGPPNGPAIDLGQFSKDLQGYTQQAIAAAQQARPAQPATEVDITGFSVSGGSVEPLDVVQPQPSNTPAPAATSNPAVVAARRIRPRPVAASQPVVASPQAPIQPLSRGPAIAPLDGDLAGMGGQASTQLAGGGGVAPVAYTGGQSPPVVGPGQPLQAQGAVAPQQAALDPNRPLLGPEDASLLPGMARNSQQGFQQQTGQVYASADAENQAAQAHLQGQNQVQDAQIAAAEASDRSLQAAMEQRARDRQAAMKSADIQIRAKQQQADDLANQEPDPSRLWNNMSGWRQATLGLAMLANAFANSRDLNHVNTVTQMLMGQVKDDVASQRDRIAKQQARAKEGIVEAKEARQTALDTVDDEYTQAITRLQSLDKIAQAKAATAGRGSALEAAYQKSRSVLFQSMQQLTAQHTTALVNKEQQARAQAHARAMAKAEAEAAITKAQIAAQVELAKQQGEIEKERLKQQGELSKEERKAKQEEEKDLRFVPSESGLRLITGRDANGNPIVVPPEQAKLHKDYVKDAGEVAVNANMLYNDISEFNRIISDKNNWDALRQGDGELNARLRELGRRIATNPAFNKGATTDKDVASGTAIFTGVANDPNFLSRFLSLDNGMDQMTAATNSYFTRLPGIVNRQLKQYPLPQGGNLEWTPPKLKGEPQEDVYTLPGEKERRSSQAVDAAVGLQPDKSTTSKLPMSDSQIATAKTLEEQTKKMTPERARETVNATFERQAQQEVAAIEAEGKAKLRQLDQNAPDYGTKAREVVAGMENARKIVLKRAEDAKFRYAAKNEAQLDKARKKQDAVVTELAGLAGEGPVVATNRRIGRNIPEPSTQAVVEALTRSGFDKALISPEDIATIKRLAVEKARNTGIKPGTKLPDVKNVVKQLGL